MCLEAIYPNTVIDPENVPVNTRGGTRKVMLACVDRFDFNWQVASDFKDAVAPLLPAGTILHQVSIFDNTASNRHNPDSTVWVGYGQRSIDEMDNASRRYFSRTRITIGKLQNAKRSRLSRRSRRSSPAQ
jgi:hypothetical protein